MNNYYFISSPLHLFVSANLAISEYQSDTNVAVLICKSEALAKQFEDAISASGGIFERVISLPEQAGVGKLNHRTYITQPLDIEFRSDTPKRLFTGNDRRFEFQYAMHVSTKSVSTKNRAANNSGQVSGIYIDDGAISYLGHKSINNFAHKYIDPILKKIAYGLWWKSGLTTGSSGWIEEAYLAFPDLAHPLLHSKRLKKIDDQVFRSAEFEALSKALLANSKVDTQQLKSIKLLISLPHEDMYLNNRTALKHCFEEALKHIDATHIAVKPHPRSENLKALEEMFPGASVIDKTIGFEALLPLLGDDVTIAGEASTTLLSTKWLRKDISVELIGSSGSDRLSGIFDKLGIKTSNTYYVR